MQAGKRKRGPTDPFAILVPQNQEMDEFYVDHPTRFLNFTSKLILFYSSVVSNFDTIL